MILTRLFLAIAFSAVWIGQSQASIIVNFDDVDLGVSVNGFYNGGTSSDLLSGPNLGVDFLADDWFTQSGFAPSSIPNFAYSDSGIGFVNVAAGFESFSFTYGAFENTTVNVWSGLGGTGTLLGSFNAVANDPFNLPVFESATVSFTGTARSVSIVTLPSGQFGWDDLEFGTAAVPEPASVCIWGIGLLGACFVSRRKLLSPKA